MGTLIGDITDWSAGRVAWPELVLICVLKLAVLAMQVFETSESCRRSTVSCSVQVKSRRIFDWHFACLIF